MWVSLGNNPAGLFSDEQNFSLSSLSSFVRGVFFLPRHVPSLSFLVVARGFRRLLFGLFPPPQDFVASSFTVFCCSLLPSCGTSPLRFFSDRSWDGNHGDDFLNPNPFLGCFFVEETSLNHRCLLPPFAGPFPFRFFAPGRSYLFFESSGLEVFPIKEGFLFLALAGLGPFLCSFLLRGPFFSISPGVFPFLSRVVYLVFLSIPKMTVVFLGSCSLMYLSVRRSQ